jgi:transposase
VASIQTPHKHTITKIPDESWDETSTILPKEKPDNVIGRPIVPYRKVMDGIGCVLRTGCQWKMLPREYCSGSTYHRRFQEWVQVDVFRKIWVGAFALYDGKEGIMRTGQSLDSISIKAPLGGAMTGNSPIDRSKLGTKIRRIHGCRLDPLFACFTPYRV